MENNTQEKRLGYLVCFEGLDRSGKSSNIKELKFHFETTHNKEVEIIRFPGIKIHILSFKLERSSITGKAIDQILKGEKKLPKTALHLLFSANRWEIA